MAGAANFDLVTEDTKPSTRPHLWWLVELLGAVPHLILLGYLWWPRTEYFSWVEGAEAAIPFALYSRAELFIVPATLLLTLVAALTARTRPLALWMLLGTTSGATLVLLALAQAAVSWHGDML